MQRKPTTQSTASNQPSPQAAPASTPSLASGEAAPALTPEQMSQLRLISDQEMAKAFGFA